MIADATKVIQARVKDTDDPTFLLHDEALEELGRALWHPLALQFRRRKLHGLQQHADTLEKQGRELAGLLRQVGAQYDLAAFGDLNVKSAEDPSP